LCLIFFFFIFFFVAETITQTESKERKPISGKQSPEDSHFQRHAEKTWDRTVLSWDVNSHHWNQQQPHHAHQRNPSTQMH